MQEKNIMTRYSDNDLMEFKELIEKKLEIANTEFEFLKNQISDLNGNLSDRDGDHMDDSNKQVEIELLHNMVFRQRQFIQNLENALIRIRNKTYGICSVTGQLIDKNRLKLVPHATKSIAGKNSEYLTKQPTSIKKPVSKDYKPKTISKIIKKQSPSSNGSNPKSDSWDEDDFEELDFVDMENENFNEDNDN